MRLAIVYALVFGSLAVLLWLIGFAAIDGTDCPQVKGQGFVTGLDTDRSLWPPGARCATEGGRADDSSVVQLFDGLSAVVIALGASAGLVLIAGALASVRNRRNHVT